MAESAVGVGMIGFGTVGRGVARLLADESALYAQRLARSIQLRKILVRDPAKAVRAGADPAIVTADAEAFFATDRMPIVVEVAGGTGPVAAHVGRALEAGKQLVTANKMLLAEDGPRLFDLARKHGVAIAFEASCAGGIPCVTALKFGLMANQIRGLYGILNGTCNYILTEMTRAGKDYDAALAEAQEKGFAEADPVLDVSGQDAAQKLAILASLAFGASVSADQVTAEGIDGLRLEDIRFGAELGYDIKLLAIAERQPGASAISVCVQPCFIHLEDLLAQVGGAFNALSVYGHAVGHTMYYGAGAGSMPTASAVVSDLINVASGWYPAAFVGLRLTPDLQAPAAIVAPDDLVSRYFLRLDALDVPGVMAKVTTILGEAGISLSAVLQHEAASGKFVPVVITTHDARQGDLRKAAAKIEKMDQINGKPVLIRIVDFPVGVASNE